MKTRATTEKQPAQAAQTDARDLPKKLVDHDDGCTCPRCVGLERCHCCGRIKLDIDWCFACGRFVL